MPISIRLDPAMEKRIAQEAKLQGVSRSEIIRRGIELYLKQEDSRPTPFELGKNLFGKHRTGESDLSENAGDRFYEALAENRRKESNSFEDYLRELKKKRAD